MTEEEDIQEIIDILSELEEDGAVPRNVKNNIQKTIKVLKEDEDISVRINKALHELDEVADDANMQQYTRTQIWNIVSMLEKMNS